MYSKLFVSMYDGTLRTRSPWQALVTFQQMLILSDPTGVVDMTPEAIAHRTGIPLEHIQTGIAALEAPDPDSRSSELEGRRIVRLDDHRTWGWQIVNFVHYHKIRNAEERREYQRNLMRKRRANGNGVSTVSTALAPVSNVGPRSTKTNTNKPLVRSNGTTAPAQPDGFAAFWLSYPRKKAKQAALRAWCKLAPDPALRDKIAGALRLQAESEEWRRDGGQYIPHPASWLNGRRWDDELAHAAATKPNGALRVSI